MTRPLHISSLSGRFHPGSGRRTEWCVALWLSTAPQGRGESQAVAKTHRLTDFIFDGRTAPQSHHHPRAAVTPRQRAGFFRRQCGGKRGQRPVSRGTMPPTTSPQQITFRAPLVDLDVACMALGKSTKQVLELFASRELLFAFDVALGSRREIRLLACELARHQGQPVERVADFNAAVKIIFPAAPQAVVGVIGKMPLTNVAKQLSIGSDHALRLARDGSLRFVKGARCRRGPNGSPEVEFSSVVDFLKSRRVA